MSDYSSLVWEWNAKRQAINPKPRLRSSNWVFIPERRAEDARLCGLVDTVYRTPCARAKVPRVKHSTAKDAPTLPAPPRFRLYRRLSASGSLCARNRWASRPKRGRAGCSVRLNAMSYAVSDAVNAQYLPQAALRRSCAHVMIFTCCLGRTKTPETTGL